MGHGVCFSQDEEGKGEGGGEYISRNARLTLMLEDELPNCHNLERVDEFAVRDFYIDRRAGRRCVPCVTCPV